MSGSGSTTSGSEYYGRIERRLQARLDYIAENTEIDILDLDVNSLDIEKIEQQLETYLGRLD